MAGINPMRDIGDLDKLIGDDFEPTQFIETVTSKLIENGKKSNGSFNAKPYIRTFEYLAENLNSMKNDLEKDIERLSNEVVKEEDGHKKQVWKFRMTTKAINTNFNRLETEMADIGGSFVRIGEQLDRVAKEKARSKEIQEIVEYFTEFNNGRTELINELRENGSEGQTKVANILRKLNTMIADTEHSGSRHFSAKKNIEIYSEAFEKQLLEEFELAYKDNDIKKMSISARTLMSFNGGLSVAKAYINQHPFFLETMIGESQATIAEASYKSLEGVTDLLEIPPPPDRWLVQLFNDTKEMVEKDWKTISVVFPNPLYILQMLIKRVFEQTVQSYLDNLLERAEKNSQLAFLRVLCSSHFAATQLIDSLKVFDVQTVTPTITALEAAQHLASSKNVDTMDFLGSNINMLSGIGGGLDTNEMLNSRFNMLSSRKTSIYHPEVAGLRSGEMNDNAEMTHAVAAMMSGINRLGRMKKTGSENGVGLSGKSERDLDSFLSSSSPNLKNSSDTGVLSLSLDRCRDDLFVSFLGGGRYLNAERAHLKLGFENLISNFHNSRVSKRTNVKQAGIFSMFTSSGGPSMTSNSPMGTGSSPNLSISNPNTPGKSGGFASQYFNQGKKQSSNNIGYDSKKNSRVDINEGQQYELQAKTVVNILYVHSESISRATELTKLGDLPAVVVNLFRFLMDFVNNEYLIIGLNDCLEELRDSKSEPNVEMILRCILVNSQVIGLVHSHYSHTVAPLLTCSSHHLLRELISDKNNFVITIESKSNVLMNNFIQSSLNWIAVLLSKQKRTDFRPGNDDFLPSFATEPCDSVVEFVLKIEALSRLCLDPNNQIRLLTEIGNELYKQLMEHFKKFTVSYLGGLVVSK
ncbi:hypothetical protein BB559_007432 [Furculomyces boomerangus]|uniref:Uncharacterized protein n=2 Tax=Harpellales TaxID=61421 RepID=A0A2T9XXG2_9FUNG|nr:hypothetical protein BB559_007432 [Furculomyces boomerangus]